MAITTTSTLTGLVATAYDKAVDFAFQPQLRFAQLAEVKKWTLDSQPTPGSSIVFTIFNNLTAVSGAIPENTDPGAQTMSKTQVSVTLAEYGKLITTTQKIRTLSFADIDLSAAKITGNNMGRSLDRIARTAFDSNTASAYIYYASGAVHATGVVSTMTLRAEEVRYAKNRLERNDVPPIDGVFYNAIVHSDCAHDLRAETGNGAWRNPREYVDPTEILNGEIGEFEGFRFIVSSMAKLETDGGSSSVDLYTNYFVGYQAAGYAEGIPPGMGISGPFDAMQRLMNVYWYGLFGFGALRDESLFKVYSASSIGNNS